MYSIIIEGLSANDFHFIKQIGMHLSDMPGTLVL